MIQTFKISKKYKRFSFNRTETNNNNKEEAWKAKPDPIPETIGESSSFNEETGLKKETISSSNNINNQKEKVVIDQKVSSENVNIIKKNNIESNMIVQQTRKTFKQECNSITSDATSSNKERNIENESQKTINKNSNQDENEKTNQNLKELTSETEYKPENLNKHIDSENDSDTQILMIDADIPENNCVEINKPDNLLQNNNNIKKQGNKKGRKPKAHNKYTKNNFEQNNDPNDLVTSSRVLRNRAINKPRNYNKNNSKKTMSLAKQNFNTILKAQLKESNRKINNKRFKLAK